MGGEDIHTARAMRDDIPRDVAKALNHAEAYGLAVPKVTENISLDENDEDFKKQVEMVMGLSKLELATMYVKTDRRLYNERMNHRAAIASTERTRTINRDLEREQVQRWRAGLNIIAGVVDNLR